MTPTRNRRLLSVGAAIALALGGSAVAFAGPDGGQDDTGESGEVGTDSLVSSAEQDGEGSGQNDDGGENATAFSAWVRELPQLGCIRGQLVASAAKGEHRGDDFEASEFESEEEMLEALELTDRRCAEVALSKAAEAEEGDGELSGETEGESNGHGPPDHAKGPKKDKPAKGGDEDSDEHEDPEDD